MADEQAFLDYVLALASRLSPIITVAYLRSLRDLAKAANVDTLTRLLDDGDVAAVVAQMLGPDVFLAGAEPLKEAIREVVAKSGPVFYRDTPPATANTVAIASIRFQALDPVVVRAIEEYEGKVFRAMGDTMRATLRQAIKAGLDSGVNPRVIARGLKDVLGLAPNQEAYIRNYELELRTLDRNALTRELTNGTFDRTVAKAIREGTPLTEAQITKGVAAYRRNWIRWQAETVSRTVTLNTMREAQRLAWKQAIRAKKVKASELVETWITTLDGRERPTHHQMHGRQKGFNDLWFVPGAGPQRYPGETEYNCLLPSTRLSAPDGVMATVRIFDGEAVTIHTASGHELACTPNHPILTPRGWIAAGALREGDEIVHSTHRQWHANITVDREDVPSTVEEVAKALLLSGDEMGLAQVEISAKDFHGDGTDGQVAIVVADRRLFVELHATPLEQIPEFALPMGLSESALVSRARALELALEWVALSAPRDVGSDRLANPRNIAHLSPLEQFSITSAATSDVVLTQNSGNHISTDTERVGESLLADAADVAIDHVVRVERRHFRGHVWNIETERGWYVAEGIVTHNCRCRTWISPRIKRASEIAA